MYLCKCKLLRIKGDKSGDISTFSRHARKYLCSLEVNQLQQICYTVILPGVDNPSYMDDAILDFPSMQ